MEMGKKIWAGAAVLLATAGLTAWAASGGLAAQRAEAKVLEHEMMAQANDAPSHQERLRTAEARAAKGTTLDVGDPDSFGKPVKWLGLMSSPSILIASSCDSVPADGSLCVPIDTSYNGHVYANLTSLDEITLPGRSIDNFICHFQTPSVRVTLRNNTPMPASMSRLDMYPMITLTSTVLNDPSLIDPETGLPMNGHLNLYMPSIPNETFLDPGQRQVLRNQASRTCIGGAVSRAGLINGYGLTSAQVDALFAGPITLTLNLEMYGSNVESGTAFLGYRFTGN